MITNPEIIVKLGLRMTSSAIEPLLWAPFYRSSAQPDSPLASKPQGPMMLSWPKAQWLHAAVGDSVTSPARRSSTWWLKFSPMPGYWLMKEDDMIGALVAKKAIAGSFKALDQHDLTKFMSAWGDDGVFIYPGDIGASGTFKGKSAVEGWFQSFFDQFPGIKFDVQDICVRNIFAITGTNLVTVHWDIQLTNRSGRVGQNSGVTVISIKGGRVVVARDYIFDLGENFRRNWGTA